MKTFKPEDNTKLVDSK